MLSFTLFVGCTSTNQVTHIEQADSIIKYKENPDKLGRFSNLYSSKKTYPVTCQENCYQPSNALVCESPAENCRFVGEQFRPEVNTGFTFRWLGHASFYLKSSEGSTLLLDPVSKQFDWPVDWAFRVANGFFRHEPKWLTSSELKDVDAALYSHIHYDHFNKGDIKNIGTKTQYFVPLGFGEHFPDDGYSINEMTWFSTTQLAELTLNFVPAHHFSSRILVPYVYEVLLKRFVKRYQNFIDNGLLNINVWKNEQNSFHLKGIISDERFHLLTGSNLNPRAWTLDLENGLLLDDPSQGLMPKVSAELTSIMEYANPINHYSELEGVSDYPNKPKKLLKKIRLTQIDRVLKRFL